MQAHLFCFLASYFVAFVCELGRLRISAVALRWVSLLATLAGMIAQTWYLAARAISSHRPPLVASTHDWLLVSAWLLIGGYLLYVIWNWKKSGVESLGLFVLPAALLLVSVSRLLNDESQGILDQQRIVTMIHASSLGIGITAVLVGFLLSLMYLLQHRRLKRKQTSTSRFSLPPLASLARMSRWTVLFSLVMLTTGLISGFVLIFAHQKAARPISWSDPVIIGFTLMWTAMMLGFGWLMNSKGTSGKQVALLNAWALGFLVITLVGLQVLVSLAGVASQHN